MYQQMKVCLDSDEKTVPFARKKLLDFYDEIPTHKDYWSITKGDFKEAFERVRGQRQRKREPGTQTLDSAHVSCGPPPKKGPSLGAPEEIDEDESDDDGG
jgi:hypothetical protein